MNQQRSRRFRASKETAEKIDEMARIRSELESKGAFVPPEKSKGEHFDSNCITPVRIFWWTGEIERDFLLKDFVLIGHTVHASFVDLFALLRTRKVTQ